jgi:hypothetical protein
MTPQEKANELVDRFDETLTYLESKQKAKQCALIAVDELLLLITYQPTIDYWNEVKHEIEKL